jgi:hypothetical protein
VGDRILLLGAVRRLTRRRPRVPAETAPPVRVARGDRDPHVGAEYPPHGRAGQAEKWRKNREAYWTTTPAPRGRLAPRVEVTEASCMGQVATETVGGLWARVDHRPRWVRRTGYALKHGSLA